MATGTYMNMDDSFDYIFDQNTASFDILKRFNDCKIKTIHINIRSIQKNFDEFLCFLSSTKIIFDIIILTETQMKDYTPYFIPGYKYHFISPNLNSFDGIAIFTNINTIENETISHCKLATCNIARLDFYLNNDNFLIYACYRSPSSNKTQFIEELGKLLSSHSTSSHCILIGDINIDILTPSYTNHTHHYITLLSAMNFNSMIQGVTRFEGTSKSCLDHIFVKTNKPLHTITATVLNTKNY